MESQPPNSAKGKSNEAVVLAEIVKWSEACPLWQRGVLHRLCAKDQLDEVDIDALVLISKGSDAPAEPIAASHVRDPAASSAVVTLKALHSVQHVNALAFGERLTFDKTGITVFYGDNGSGKSGYARILKKACRARSLKGETVLPNIYATTNGQAMATFEFLVNGQNRSSTWLLNQCLILFYQRSVFSTAKQQMSTSTSPTILLTHPCLPRTSLPGSEAAPKR